MIDLIVKCFNLEFPSATCKLVALAVARRCGGDLGECFASQATLADDTQVHPKTVGRCLAELEALGWISRTKFRASNTGHRRTDKIFLTLPEVVLPATVRKGQDDNLSHEGSPGSGANVADDSLDTESRTPQRDQGRDQSKEDSAGLSSGEHGEDDDEQPEGVDLKLAVDLIWKRVGDRGRERSSKADVRTALAAALKRRPADQTEEERLKLILQGIDGYLRSPEARKENGAFERGAHRSIEKDRWESFVADDQGQRAAAAPEVGTREAPGPALQRLWMERWSQQSLWDVGAQGPRPGQDGCRVAADLQREFGVEIERPMADPLGDDAAAFD